uniref:Uncharacterized protein n=1 Tax=Knipowitschia caucasica TaxID=637954 RepID=A0AAV2J4I9_KNICA
MVYQSPSDLTVGQFLSTQFQDFCKENGIQHVKTTPKWAQANGEVERQNASIMKRIRIAHAEGLDWQKELRKYVTVYRSIEHSTTGRSPAELLFNRKLRGKLPDISTPRIDIEARDTDAENKGKYAEYADQRRGAKPSPVQVGDEILLKQDKVQQGAVMSHSQWNSSVLLSNLSHTSVFTEQVLPPLYLSLLTVGLPLNALASLVFCRVRSEAALVVYLKNMLLSDVMMMSCFPFRLMAQRGVGGWRIHVLICRFVAVVFYSSMYTSIMFMGLISLERYMKIVLQTNTAWLVHFLQSPGSAHMVAMAVWTLMLLSALPNVLLTNREANEANARRCMELKSELGVHWHQVSTLFSVAMFWLTLVVMTTCYIAIAVKVWRSSRRSGSSSGARRRSSRSIVSLLLVFCICFIPYHLCRVPYTLSQMPWSQASASTRWFLYQLKEVSLVLSSCNVCLDPLWSHWCLTGDLHVIHSAMLWPDAGYEAAHVQWGPLGLAPTLTQTSNPDPTHSRPNPDQRTMDRIALLSAWVLVLALLCDAPGTSDGKGTHAQGTGMNVCDGRCCDGWSCSVFSSVPKRRHVPRSKPLCVWPGFYGKRCQVSTVTVLYAATSNQNSEVGEVIRNKDNRPRADENQKTQLQRDQNPPTSAGVTAADDDVTAAALDPEGSDERASSVKRSRAVLR